MGVDQRQLAQAARLVPKHSAVTARELVTTWTTTIAIAGGAHFGPPGNGGLLRAGIKNHDFPRFFVRFFAGRRSYHWRGIVSRNVVYLIIVWTTVVEISNMRFSAIAKHRLDERTFDLESPNLLRVLP